jgi:hypothetical protein
MVRFLLKKLSFNKLIGYTALINQQYFSSRFSLTISFKLIEKIFASLVVRMNKSESITHFRLFISLPNE